MMPVQACLSGSAFLNHRRMSSPDPDPDPPLALDTLRTLAHRALEAASAAGADAAEAVTLATRALSLTVRNGVAEETERAEDTALGLRAFVGQRAALVRLDASGDVAVAAERAVAMARVAPDDPSLGLADPGSFGRGGEDLQIDDGQADTVTVATLTDRTAALEEAMLHTPGVTNSGGAFAGVRQAARWMAASNGFSDGYLTTSHSHGVTAIAGDGTRMERDSWYSSKRHLSDLDDPQMIGRTAGERAARRLDGEALTTRKATIVYEHRAASGFIGHILSALNGEAIARRASLFAERRGERVLGEGISLIDDPFLVRGLASRPFDGEGLAGAPLTLIEDGVLKHFALDLGTARRLGLSPNGRANRGIGTPSPGTTNVAVRGGSGTLASLMAEAGSGLLVTDLIGMGANIVNGIYSRGAAGFWFENGEITHPVSEITIAGDLSDMFARARFADDAPGRYSVDAPAIAIDGLTIGGR